MIRSKDLNKELRDLEVKVKEGKVSETDIVKAIVLVAKVVRDVRTNQVTTMRNSGVELIKSDTKETKKEEETE